VGAVGFFGSQCVPPSSSQWVPNIFPKFSIAPHFVPIFFAETLSSWKEYRWANIGSTLFLCFKVFFMGQSKRLIAKKFQNLEDTPNYFYFVCSFQPNLAKCYSDDCHTKKIRKNETLIHMNS
jgi:hypothetical protein